MSSSRKAIDKKVPLTHTGFFGEQRECVAVVTADGQELMAIFE